MAYLLQLYRQENSLKYRLRNKLLINNIHIKITEGRRCAAEGRGKNKKRSTWEGQCSVLFDLVKL